MGPPYHVYVQPGATGGDGTQAAPYDTIPDALAAVSPAGTVYLLPGTYPVTSTTTINTAGVVLKGYPGTVIQQQAPVASINITGSGVTLEGLTFTSDNPYAVEFVRVAGSNHRIVNNVFFGPPQPGPSSGWVVNRGFVTQPLSTTNLLVQHNVFRSLRQAAYLNPSTSGSILNNIVYNTRGIIVDGAEFTISGNSWGNPENDIDIVLLAGTAAGAPYDPLAQLAASNSDATISDQR